MLSKKERERKGYVGVKTLINEETGEKIVVDFDETPVFSMEEVRRLRIGEPDMKPFSEMTEEEMKVFSWEEANKDEDDN